MKLKARADVLPSRARGYPIPGERAAIDRDVGRQRDHDAIRHRVVKGWALLDRADLAAVDLRMRRAACTEPVGKRCARGQRPRQMIGERPDRNERPNAMWAPRAWAADGGDIVSRHASNGCANAAPDDRLREAIQSRLRGSGLLASLAMTDQKKGPGSLSVRRLSGMRFLGQAGIHTHDGVMDFRARACAPRNDENKKAGIASRFCFLSLPSSPASATNRQSPAYWIRRSSRTMTAECHFASARFGGVAGHD